MDNFENSIKYVKSVGEKRAQLFSKLGINTVGGLLTFFPRNYEDWSNVIAIKDAPFNEVCCIKATLATSVTEHKIKKGLTLYKCSFTDGENLLHVTIFNNNYLAASLRIYEQYLLYGKVERTLTSFSMSSPRIELAQIGEGVRPVYHATGGLSSRMIETAVKNALSSVSEFEETLSEKIRLKYDLATRDYAMRNIHFPPDNASLERAKKRLVFEELLVLQLALMRMKTRSKGKNSAKIKKDFSSEFVSALPFTLTNAQLRTVRECTADMLDVHPMNRLVQGDVGSGKTVVAAAIAYSVVKSSMQCAVMAPTAVLASQHYETFSSFFKPFDIRVELLTGSTTAAKKREIKKALLDGEIDVIIGTHALIQNDVEFENLGLVITDEQHRFGVEQRATLAQKGVSPHTLVMSATPIPRTLAMMIYGDLDISVIDELPKGRQKIDTFVVDSSYHQRLYNFIKKEIDSGRQAYVVCPLVEEGETDLTSASEYAKELQNKVFSEYNVGLMHGKMKSAEKEKIMTAFSNGEIQLLVSTTVIEVGVDVPNATVMMVENAERFGLSQLHQLRGRVGRGKYKSYCVLVSDSKGENTMKRLNTLRKTNDGFVIADEDLRLRGPGDFFGSRQHGLPDLKISDMLHDVETLHRAQQCARAVLAYDETLSSAENKLLSKEVSKLLENMK